VPLDHKALLEAKVQPDHKEAKGTLAHKVQLAHKERKAQQALRVKLDLRDLQVLRGQLGHRGILTLTLLPLEHMLILLHQELIGTKQLSMQPMESFLIHPTIAMVPLA